MSAVAARLRLPGRLPRLGSGVSAIIVKELRGRMRGRRAFVIVTLYLVLLATYAWMLQRINEEAVAGQSFGGQVTYASATVGRGIFVGLLLLQTLMVAVLAPAATAGAISSERERQTLDMLTATPISSVAIVFGKTLSALAWVFVLVLASIPVTALVFVFGGVAPDDVLRGYAVLFATVIGLGSIGVFFSALTRRTGASTGLTFVVTLALTIGSIFVFDFMKSTAPVDSTGLRRQPTESVLYLNPFIAQYDVACGTEDGGFGPSCDVMAGIVGRTDFFVPPDVMPVEPQPGFGRGPAPGFPVTDQDGPEGEPGGGATFDVVEVGTVASFRDRLWPKTVASFLILATLLTIASVQFVSPTRRWRPVLPGPIRRRIGRRNST